VSSGRTYSTVPPSLAFGHPSPAALHAREGESVNVGVADDAGAVGEGGAREGVSEAARCR